MLPAKPLQRPLLILDFEASQVEFFYLATIIDVANHPSVQQRACADDGGDEEEESRECDPFCIPPRLANFSLLTTCQRILGICVEPTCVTNRAIDGGRG